MLRFLFSTHGHHSSAIKAALVCYFLAILVLMLVTWRQEIRRDGIYSIGRLIRWDRIARWHWVDVPRGINTLFQTAPCDAVLVLELRHAMQFLPAANLRIPRAEREQVEAIIRRELGEWPGA